MPEKRSRFVLLTRQVLAVGAVVAIAAPAAGVVTLDIVAPAPQRAASRAAGHVSGSLVASAPVRPTVHEVPVSGIDPRGLAALESPQATEASGDGLRLSAAETTGGTGDLAALTAPEPVNGLGTVGVTWQPGTRIDDADITVSVRTQTDGVWSSWQTVPYHDDHGPDPASAEGRRARPGTDPVYLGDVDDVQMKAVTATGEAPADMELAVVDPGQESAPAVEKPAIDTAKLASAETGVAPGLTATATTSATPTATATPTAAATATPTATASPTATTSPSPTATASPSPSADPTGATLAGTPADVTPKPLIYSRAQWGADERMRDKSSLHYGEVHAGFVHHTVNANGYTRAQVPSIIRGIYAYHTQSRGWSDIGYNFVVDRFGRIWEGRYGGVDRPVVGAHTLGYNDYAFAMSAIGNYDIYDGGKGLPSQAMLDAYGRLFAWKLSLHGVDAGSTRQWVGKRYLQAINGHRDTGEATACPGRYLYAKIPTIRALAAADQHAWAPRGKDNDLAGTRWPDLVVRDKTSKRALVVRTAGQVGFAAPRVAASGFGGMDLVTAARDLTGDGVADMVARSASTKDTAVYPGDGAGRFGAAVATTHRFAGVDQLVGVGDLDGDGHNDLVGRDATSHALLLFPGRGDGTFKAQRTLVPDWSGYGLTAGVGDLTGDGRPDLVARAGKVLSLFAGTARGGLAAPVTLPGRWGGFDVIAGLGDVTNDGKADIVARVAKTGTTFLYPGTGTGGLGTRYGGFTTFKGVDFLAAAGQVAGSWRADLVGRDAKGRLVVFTNNGGHNLGKVTDTGRSFASANLVLNVGDWNGDGHGDVMTRATSTGNMLLYAGDGKGHFADPVTAARGWSSVGLLTAVGDITGDGFPDLMGQPSGAAMRIYPGNGATGFKRSYVAHAAVSGDTQVGVGLWDGDGSPDTLVRRSDGTLALYPGNGPGGLTGSGTAVASGTGRYDWVQGVGDADGDGRPDVVAREKATGRLWLLPSAGTGFGPRRYIASGFGAYDLGD